MSTTVRYSPRAKVGIVLVLVLGIGAFVVAGLSAETDVPEEATVSGDANAAAGDGDAPPSTIANGVESIDPGRGTEAFAQETVTIDLAPGWTGELAFRSGPNDAVPLPADEVEVTELAELVYQPGEGKTFERLPTGRLCVEATIWDQVRGRDATERLETWCFDVT